jgi:serine/threonine-protein kinase
MPVTALEEGDEGLVGRVVDNRYRIVSKLGQGGMGAVFLAEHVGIGKRVAIKVLRADLRGKPALVRRFRREAMAVSRLSDAHTITVFDFGIWRGLVYLVMEYLRGEDLGDVLAREGALPPGRVLHIAQQICSSLAEAHAVGIVHRDLKPDNIFLTRTTAGDERVKVLDFGIAKIIAGEDLFDAGDQPRFETQKGALIGTPYFMAPEQVTCDPIDARTDLYALGALLYRMLTGRYPHQGRSPMDVLMAHVNEPPPPFAEVAADRDIPPEVEAMVLRLMARSPAQRPRTALLVSYEITALSVTVTDSGGASLPDLADGAVALEAAPAARPAVAQDVSATEPIGGLDGVFEVESGDLLAREDFDRFERRLRRMRLLTALGAVALVVALGWGAWYVAAHRLLEDPTRESEPNDDSKDADWMEPGTAMEGHLGARAVRERSDWDVFWLEVPVGATGASAEVSGVPGMDIVLEGFDIDGEKLFGADEGSIGEGERVAGGSVRGPRLMVLVREVWTTGVPPTENTTDPYRLTVRFER